jgi:hypothetical protein
MNLASGGYPAYDLRQVLKTLESGTPLRQSGFFVPVRFCSYGQGAPYGNAAARLSTSFHTLSASAENRGQKSLERSNS